MKRLAVIVLLGLLMTCIDSIASSQSAEEGTPPFAKSKLSLQPYQGLLLLHDEQAPLSTTPTPVEEESEDEDDTAKEKVLQKAITMNHCLFLRQLYWRQYLIFKEHHQEITTPPPKF